MFHRSLGYLRSNRTYLFNNGFSLPSTQTFFLGTTCKLSNPPALLNEALHFLAAAEERRQPSSTIFYVKSSGEKKKEKIVALKANNIDNDSSRYENDAVAFITRQFKSILRKKHKDHQKWKRGYFPYSNLAQIFNTRVKMGDHTSIRNPLAKEDCLIARSECSNKTHKALKTDDVISTITDDSFISFRKKFYFPNDLVMKYGEYWEEDLERGWHGASGRSMEPENAEIETLQETGDYGEYWEEDLERGWHGASGRSMEPENAEIETMQESKYVNTFDVSKKDGMSFNLPNIDVNNKFNILDNLVEEGEIVTNEKNLEIASMEDMKEVNIVTIGCMEDNKVDEMKDGNSSILKGKGSKQLKGLGPINSAPRSRKAEGEGKDKLGTISPLVQ
ncbi:hypothetical protein MA16_Dca016490 [Dendrobium catenatum]|uniref:Uncharacterized protein n=1 Tax=Dendrobium catenatum TaxID=906689 RepID=A0A2I0X655_9ASPA|nr:hypothetical protein MA16_Dca016490 [Dendrobium catenatum]